MERYLELGVSVMTDNNSLNWKHVFNSIKDSIVLLDTNGLIKNCNEAFKKLVNKSSTQIIDYECSKIIFGRTVKLKNCPYLRSKRSKKRESLTVEKDNRWFNVDVDPILDENHQISGFVLFTSDITEHNKAEKVIEESEEKFRTLTENINVGIYRNTVGQKGKFIEANPAIVKMFGFKNKEEFLAHNVSELYLQPEERKKFNDEMLEKGFVKDKVLKLMQIDGTPFYGSISAVTIKDSDGNLQFFDGIIEDITNRKKAEKALWESEKKYKDLFEKSKDAILIIHNGKFVDCNQATINMLRYNNKDEFLNTHPSELSPEKQPDGEMSLPKADEMMKIAFENGSHRFEWNHKKSDGEIFPVEVLLTTISSDEENLILHTVWRDITERKKAEEELIKGRERLKMLNKIIRHDISNDFIVIKSAINIFRRTSNMKMVNEIEKRVDRSLTTIDTYREYESFIDSNADLNKIETSELLNEIVVEYPQIKFNIDGKCSVFADEAINSVFINLISNSIQHGKASKIDIGITSENDICKIEFKDNGTGIPDKIKGKIFEEGFSHGKAGHTGIGLHIVRKTIESYGGSISVENNKPNGAVFKIQLKNAL